MSKPPIPKLVLTIVNQPDYEDLYVDDFGDCKSKKDIIDRINKLFYVYKDNLDSYVGQELENRQEIVDYLCNHFKENIAKSEAEIRAKEKATEEKRKIRELKELERLKKKYEK